MDFEKLKKAKKGNNTFEDLAKKAESHEKKSFEKDLRYFVPTPDKEGNGLVIMRFLPNIIDGEDSEDWVELYKHAFKDDVTQQWYIELSRTTLPKPNSKYGQDDFATESNGILWKTGIEANQKLARKRKRQHKYISNVLILKNDNAPDTVGNNYLYEYGEKVRDKIFAKTKADIEGDVVFDAFNPWTGGNFRLKFKIKDGQRNYDDSYFDQPSVLYNGDDEKIKALLKETYSLKAEIAPEKFKTYEELKARFLLVTSGKVAETAESSEVNASKPFVDEPETISKVDVKASTSKETSKPKSSFFDTSDETDEIPW